MSEKFDIYSKIFFSNVENFFRHLCELVLRHQMLVSNYFVNSFYSVVLKSSCPCRNFLISGDRPLVLWPCGLMDVCFSRLVLFWRLLASESVGHQASGTRWFWVFISSFLAQKWNVKNNSKVFSLWIWSLIDMSIL